jgi:hypothetical protein
MERVPRARSRRPRHAAWQAAKTDERWPGARVAITTRVDAHHGWARYGWTIQNARGESLLDGMDVAEAAEDGRLRRVVMFYVAPERLNFSN